MLPVIAGLSIAFVALHFVPSHPPIRRALIRRLGLGTYLGLYSLLVLVLFVPLLWLWLGHRFDQAPLWVVRDPGVERVMNLVMLGGTAFIGAGVIDASPASITSHYGDLSSARTEVRGIAAVTRHPLMTGLGLLSAAHLVLNGWPADLWFWGAMWVLATVGAWHQDLRQSREPRYVDFQSRTTVLPNLLGVQRLTAQSWVGVALGIVGGIALRWLHPWFA